MDIALPVLGGLGLFLYGMNVMGTGLEKAAGERLKKLIEVLTNNRYMGVLVGALVTMIIQSSSATTVMVIGFVNAGIMTLSQAVGVIMGANVGTTVTSQLIAFKLTKVAPVAVAIGMVIWMVSSRKKSKNLAEIIIGFGILFVGMDMMTSGLSPLTESAMFQDMMVNLNSPFIGVIVGIVLTTLLQSSSASIGLLQALGSQGLISLNMAIPILFGDNIGTTTTTLISSVGANKTAKRAALIHFLFNLIGTIIFVTILKRPVEFLVLKFSPDNVQRQIANAHTMFNLANVIIQVPFAGLLVKMAKWMVPGDEIREEGMSYLDLRIMKTPSIALGQANKEILRMGKIAKENLITASKAFRNQDMKMVREAFEQEKVVNRLERDIVEYLVELSKAPLSEEQHSQLNVLINIVNDIERVGDHADNIAELSEEIIEDGLKFTEEAIGEFDIIFEKTREVFAKALESLEEGDLNKAIEAVELEQEVNELEKKYRNTHIYRLNQSLCVPSSGVMFLDILSNLERVADHSYNIAKYVLD